MYPTIRRNTSHSHEEPRCHSCTRLYVDPRETFSPFFLSFFFFVLAFQSPNVPAGTTRETTKHDRCGFASLLFFFLAVWCYVGTDAGGSPSSWRLSATGQTCSDACSTDSSLCSAGARNSVSSAERIQFVLSTYFGLTCDSTESSISSRAPETSVSSGTRTCRYQTFSAASCFVTGDSLLCCCSGDSNDCPVSG